MNSIKLFQNKKVLTLLAIAAAVITIVGFFIDLRNTLNYPGTDLRNRVVGARLALDGIDPYFFKWRPGLSEQFYDPLDIPTELISKLSVPPTILVLHSLFAKLPYLSQKLIWLGVQWSALLCTVGIFFRNAPSRSAKKIVLAISFLFANSLFWRFHVNSGQIYIVYVFLLSIAWMLLNKPLKFHEFYSGFFVGITASFRPSFILFSIPFLIGKKIYFIAGGILGILSSLSVSLLLFKSFIWQRYILTMLIMIGAVDPSSYPSLDNRLPNVANITYPQVIEGFDSSIRNPLEIYLDNTSFYDILNALDLPNKRYILAASFILFLVLCFVSVFYSIAKGKNINCLFLLGVLICLIGDFFIPVGRYSYYDIQMILPLLILATKIDAQQLVEDKIIFIAIVGLLLSFIGFIAIPRALFFSVFLILFYIVFASFNYIRQNKFISDSQKVV